MTIVQQINILKAPFCACGRTKQIRTPLCGPCYRKLPTQMKQSLYDRIPGFAVSYQQALEFLKVAKPQPIHTGAASAAGATG